MKQMIAKSRKENEYLDAIRRGECVVKEVYINNIELIAYDFDYNNTRYYITKMNSNKFNPISDALTVFNFQRTKKL